MKVKKACIQISHIKNFLYFVGHIASIKGQLYIFSMCNSDNPCTNMNSVFFLDLQNEWKEFKKEGNVTDFVTIFPFQA